MALYKNGAFVADTWRFPPPTNPWVTAPSSSARCAL